MFERSKRLADTVKPKTSSFHDFFQFLKDAMPAKSAHVHSIEFTHHDVAGTLMAVRLEGPLPIGTDALIGAERKAHEVALDPKKRPGWRAFIGSDHHWKDASSNEHESHVFRFAIFGKNAEKAAVEDFSNVHHGVDLIRNRKKYAVQRAFASYPASDTPESSRKINRT